MERDLNLQLIRAHLSPLINYLGDLNYYFYGDVLEIYLVETYLMTMIWPAIHKILLRK